MATTVVNIKSDEGKKAKKQANFVYIGRPTQADDQVHHWGNPFTHLRNKPGLIKVPSRGEAVAAFSDWFFATGYNEEHQEQRDWMWENISYLRDKVLGCFCKPDSCHGDVLAQYVNSTYNKEEPVAKPYQAIIDEFDGEYRFLSNFYYESTIRERLYGYITVENYYQAMKTLDKADRAKFKTLRPGQAKRKGGKNGDIKLRDDWNDISVKVMLDGVTKKFAPGTELAEKLVATGTALLVEGNNWHDIFWGVCNGQCRPETRLLHNNGEPMGENRLGTVLMWVREELVDPNVHAKCFKCGGTGLYFKGSDKGPVPAGQCYQCQGNGVETVEDRMRTNYYFDHVYNVFEAREVETPEAPF